MDINQIKATIKAHGYNMAKVAKALGISPSALWQSLNNGGVKVERLEEIAIVIGADVSEFFAAPSPTQTAEIGTITCPHCGKSFSAYTYTISDGKTPKTANK